MFENLHRNKKLAFLDGFFTGASIAIMAAYLWKDYVEAKAVEKALDEAIETSRSEKN